MQNRVIFWQRLVCLMIISLLGSLCSFQSAAKDEGSMFLRFEPSEKRIFQNQRVVVDMVLYVPVGLEVASINRISKPDFGGLRWTESSLNRRDRSVLDGEKTKDGKYLRTTVGRYVVMADSPGEFKIEPGRHYADVMTGEKKIDPFWGTAYYRKDRIEIRPEENSIRVSQAGQGTDLSKSGVGEFDARWILPPGDIEPQQEGIVILELQGYGDLENAEWPDLAGSFGSGLKFIGMSPDVNVYIKEGRIYSEARLECTFSASEPGEYILESAAIPYFSTDRHKIRQARTKPIPIRIEKSKTPGRPLQYLDI